MAGFDLLLVAQLYANSSFLRGYAAAPAGQYEQQRGTQSLVNRRIKQLLSTVQVSADFAIALLL